MEKKRITTDPFALRRSKEMTPGARLDWLAAAWEWNRSVEESRKRMKNEKK